MTLNDTASLDNRRKRLIFRSWHRGTREMDLIMGSFAETNVPSMTGAELDLYEELLHTPDPDVYDWFVRTSGGKGHITRMQAVLRAYMAAHRDAPPDPK